MPQEPPLPQRPDTSMSFLNNLMENSLDEGYAEAVARRGEVGASHMPKALRAKLGLAAGLLLTALVVTLGAAQAQETAPTLAKERQKLIERIRTETAEADELTETLASLRGDVAEMQRGALESHGGDSVESVALSAGATEVTGPGVKLVLDDAKDEESGDPGGSAGFSDVGRVRDRDMQRVVNGLWASGAEAVSVNDQRLTGLSAIRAAGDAILVDNKPLGPPYTVLAIGDGQRLGDEFHKSPDGQYLAALVRNYGIRATVTAEETLRLRAASSLNVHYAKPVGTGKVDK